MAYTMTRLLRWRILLYAACTLLVLSALVAMGLGIPLMESWRHSEEILLQATVRNKAVSVEAWLRHAEGVAWHIAGRSDLRDTLEKLHVPLPTTEDQLAERQLLEFSLRKILKSSLRQNGDILGITLVDSRGLSITRLGAAMPDSLWSDASFSTVKARDTSAADMTTQAPMRIMPPHLLDDEECLFFAVPVYDSQGAVLATLIIARRTVFLRRILLEESTSLHDEVTLGMQSTRGFSLMDAAKSFVSVKGATGAIAADVSEAIKAAREGQQGVLSRGASVIAYAPVGSSGWALCLRTPTTRLYAPALEHFWNLIPWIIAAYAGILGGFWLLSRPLAGRILLHTHELAAEVDQRRQAEASLQVALHTARQENSRRKQLAAELINVLEGMRQNLARELHDNTGQMLTTLLLQLDSNATSAPHTQEQWLSAASCVRHIQQQLRELASGLRPQLLDIAGLVAALKSLCTEFQQGGLVVHFFYAGCTNLARDKALALYRIAQGALTNVVRHSKADSVHISLVERADAIVLTVEDNGQGFDVQRRLHAASLSKSLGLTLMQERLACFSGSLHIESSPTKGTLLVVEIPVHAEHA